ncbi:MAG: pseudaminic acid synthase [Candidatus Omnitrophica bacterium]|nr:pseudaminic acid synthase [Candidatus Omnitrophota bacterium]
MKNVSRDKKTFIIAEISANHGQNIGTAIKLIRASRACGVDAVKFQTYTPDTLTIDSALGHFRIDHPRWGGQTLYELYRKAYTPWKWFKKLKKEADDQGLGFLSTAFDPTSVDFLEELGVSTHKIASFELIDIPLIEYVSGTKKPLIMSTGMASRKEVRAAVTAARSHGAGSITLLKCVSSYPAVPEEMNLRTIPDMRSRFGCPIGLSDHSLSAVVPVVAVALGASVIEKHFTLSRAMKTPDSFFSLEPDEMKQLVQDVRTAEKASGDVSYKLTAGEKKNRIFRRSLFIVEDIKKGALLTAGNIRSIRPANGIAPVHIKTVIGKRAGRALRRGTPLKLSHFYSGRSGKG